jgi:predicted PurR-regulated permease PerM
MPGTGDRRNERLIGGLLVAVLLAGSLLVLMPFMTALLWAVVLSYSSWPLYRRACVLVGGRRTLAALLMTLATTLVLLVPLLVVGLRVADNAQELAVATRHRLEQGPPEPPAWVARVPLVGDRAYAYWKSVARDGKRFTDSLEPYVRPVLAWVMAGGLMLGRGLLDVALSILIAFFLYRDGAAASGQLKAAVNRVAGERGQRLLELAGNTVRSVVYGILGTALVQGVMAGVGFLIAGVPGSGLLGLLTFFLSIIPMGPPLVWVPAAIYLFAKGAVGWGVFMVVWGLLVSSVDNVVKPWLISRGTALPFIIILMGVLGGAIAFGFIGVFLGPTLLAVCYSFLREWATRLPDDAIQPVSG